MRVLTVVGRFSMPKRAVKIKDGQVDLSGSKLVVDTMDEYGVEEALRLRDVGAATEVVTLAIGVRTRRRGLAHCARDGRRPRHSG